MNIHSVNHQGTTSFENLVSEYQEPEGCWQRFSSVKYVELAKLFCTSLSPFHSYGSSEGTSPVNPEPMLVMSMPSVSDLPGIISLGGHLVAQALPGSSMLGKLATAVGTFYSSFQLVSAAVIPVADAETLSKIGRDPNLPLDGNYQQTSDIDASNINPIGCRLDPFQGYYDGNGRKIIGTKHCLFEKMGGNSTVKNIRISHADITSEDLGRPVGVITCSMGENSLITNALVENSKAETLQNYANVAIGTGRMEGNAKITSLDVVNSSVSSHGYKSRAAVGSGLMNDDTRIEDLKALNCQVSSTEWGSSIGVGTGYAAGRAVVSGVSAVDCQLHSTGGSVASAIGAGEAWNEARIENTLAVLCDNSVETTPRSSLKTRAVLPNAWAAAGVGIAMGKSKVSNTTALGSRFHVKSPIYGGDTFAAIGTGDMRKEAIVENTEGVHCQIATNGHVAQYAGIGAGRVWAGDGPKNTLARNCSLSISRGDGNDAAAAIGGVRLGHFGMPADKRISGTACESSHTDRYGFYRYPNAPECSNICWTSVSNIGSNATGIHFDQTCDYVKFNTSSVTSSTNTPFTTVGNGDIRSPSSHLPPTTQNSSVNVVDVAEIPAMSTLAIGGLVGGAALVGAVTALYCVYSKSGDHKEKIKYERVSDTETQV
ncbi:hypothetical protein [Endozoicomonas sp. SCSIO W0465]|uniref:hypothetical protein n=1 Tax=Endozoicomonas sp. SCSIO W0465 TaxID=2918516 RepID=UPI0020764F69|nr:hypothetical protein [Endozoicomonas sp. SCSIO W0465]USE36701.1 hypothetical protein MJO57_00170 [Endozoicomonas sp. SCSIO W0465]